MPTSNIGSNSGKTSAQVRAEAAAKNKARMATAQQSRATTPTTNKAMTASRTKAPSQAATKTTSTTPTPTTRSNRQTTTFQDIIGSSGAQQIQSKGADGRTVDKYRFQQFDYGKDRYGFDDKGAIVRIGSSTSDTGGKVVGIEETGRKFNIGETAEIRNQMQKNVVTGANAGGFKTRTQQMEDAKRSAEMGGRVEGLRSAPLDQDELSRLFGAGSFGAGTGEYDPSAISGADKAAKYRSKGLLDNGTRSVAEMVDVDFTREIGLFDNPPRKGENEDAKDYAIRKATWERDEVSNAFNTVRREMEVGRLKDAIGDVTDIQRRKEPPKTKEEMMNELRNDDGFASQYNVAKQQYKSKREAEAKAIAEKRGRFATGSSATIKAIRKAILDEEMKKASNDVSEFDTIANKQKTEAMDRISDEAAKKSLEFTTLSDADVRKKNQEQDRIDREKKYIDEGYTALEAEAKVKADIKAFGSTSKMANYDQFQKLRGTGDINEDFSNAGMAIFNKITKNKGEIKKILENTPGMTPDMVNDQLFSIDKVNNPALTREAWDQYSVKGKELDNQDKFLSGELEPQDLKLYMDGIEVDSPDKAKRLYQVALQNGVYSDNPLMQDLMNLRLNRLEGPEADKNRTMSAMVAEWEYATPSRKSDIQSYLEQSGRFGEFMDAKLSYKSDEFNYANLALQNVPIQLRNSEGEREFFLAGIKGLREQGYSPYEAADRVLGFIVKDAGDKPMADFLRRRYNASPVANDGGLKDIARAINEGDPLTSIAQVENTLLNSEDSFSQQNVETMFKTTKEIKDLIKHVGPEFMGALDSTMFRLGKFTGMSQLRSKVDGGKRKDAARLGAMLARVMVADAQAFGGTLSPDEIEILQDQMATIGDQPFEAMEKIQLIEDQALRKHNALRRTVRLPEYASPDEMIFDDLKLGVYQDEAGRGMSLPEFVPSKPVETEKIETNNVEMEVMPTSREGISTLLKNNGFSSPTDAQIDEAIRINNIQIKTSESAVSSHTVNPPTPERDFETKTGKFSGRDVTFDTEMYDAFEKANKDYKDEFGEDIKVGAIATSSYRSPQQQKELYGKGRTPEQLEKAGFSSQEAIAMSQPNENIVTQTLKSRHMEGRALDLYPDKKYIAEVKPFLEKYGIKQDTAGIGDYVNFEMIKNA